MLNMLCNVEYVYQGEVIGIDEVVGHCKRVLDGLITPGGPLQLSQVSTIMHLMGLKPQGIEYVQSIRFIQEYIVPTACDEMLFIEVVETPYTLPKVKFNFEKWEQYIELDERYNI